MDADNHSLLLPFLLLELLHPPLMEEAKELKEKEALGSRLNELERSHAQNSWQRRECCLKHTRQPLSLMQEEEEKEKEKEED